MKTQFNLSEVARSFSAAAKEYDGYAFLQYEIGHRLLERLDCLKATPSIILDVGAGTGKLTRELQKRYSKAQVIGVDLAPGMVAQAKLSQSFNPFRKQPTYLCADMAQLPFNNQSVDLIFSNCTLQWGNSLNAIFSEFKRILTPGGTLFFSTFGPQTLHELRSSFAKQDNNIHVHNFCDMHDIGDLLLNCPFTDPVIDMEMLTLTYQSVSQLLHDLKGTGARNLDITRHKGCLSSHSFKKMLKAYEEFKRPDSLYPATYEVIYGHAVKARSPLHRQDSNGVITIPADKIPRLL